MILTDILFVFIIALFLTILLSYVFSWRHPRMPGTWPSALFLFLVLLAVIWAGGIWSDPYGPAWHNSYWLPFLLVGLFVALLILALGIATPPPGERRTMKVEPAAGDEAVATGVVAAFSVFFWLLLLGAVTAITFYYIN